MTPYPRADALMEMLFPLWQLVIGAVVALVLVVASWRLARRGPSRMGTVLLITGGAIVGITVFGILSARTV
ncbi:hypothetical protein ACFFX1_53240 [Dactylosporangium sucinum]|uniref:Uncharacterized protein n=1 Tax=Dactylosporangium sucinum TaxID=1424081 RepID=A0A917UAF6_9ACTN|nr:hypothetical protein [Dactylosporangium sucinum]GGM72082.1 hypothetical protein GCM10007977_087280 [Dactylosporangium sucinum]